MSDSVTQLKPAFYGAEISASDCRWPHNTDGCHTEVPQWSV
jgi:hypothetical protein